MAKNENISIDFEVPKEKKKQFEAWLKDSPLGKEPEEVPVPLPPEEHKEEKTNKKYCPDCKKKELREYMLQWTMENRKYETLMCGSCGLLVQNEVKK